MIKVNVTGNAHAHKLAYGRGIHLVSRQIADRLVKVGVATVIEEPRSAVIEPEVRTADIKTKPKKKRRRK